MGRKITVDRREGCFEATFGLGLTLRRAHLRAAAAFAEALAPLGIQLRHFAVLVELSEESPLRQSDLARRTDNDKVSMMRIVDHMENAGLVVRRAQPGDRRVRAVEMTEDGRRMYDAAHRAAQDVSADLLEHLPPRERDRFTDLLARFTAPPGKHAVTPEARPNRAGP